MNKLFFAALMLLPFFSRAQNLIPNGSFETCCVGTNGCQTFSDLCAPPWFVTHGTPQHSRGNAYDQDVCMTMWSHGGQSEGLGVRLSVDLIPGNTYRLCFAYRVQVEDDSEIGDIHVKLANVIPHHIDCYGGGPVPAVSPSQEIFLQPFPTGVTGLQSWQYVSTVFIAENNFRELWVYPLKGSTSGDPVNIWVDFFSIIPNSTVSGECTDDLFMDINNYPFPAGLYHQYAHIVAGSHVNGLTTPLFVSVNQPSTSTTFRADQSIILADNFQAIPLHNSVFIAEIGFCPEKCPDPIQERIMESEVFSLSDEHPSSDEPVFSIFPNPSSGIFILTSNTVEIASLEVLDVFGKSVIEKMNFNNYSTEIDLLDKKPGVYFVRIVTSQKTQTIRLIKQ